MSETAKPDKNGRGAATSDVDENIPITNTLSENTFVLIISNENYKWVTNVQYANHDGIIMKEYCKKTLGIPEENIQLVQDATYGEMRKAVTRFSQIINAYDNDCKALFYYSGHGIPDEKTASAYLLPTDADATDLSVSYSLNKLYEELGQMHCQSVTVFLDACFSGASRANNGEMLYVAKGVAIKEQKGTPQGNTVVLSAPSPMETAGFYQDKQHGMFTYFILKKIQETKGDVSLADLSEYVAKEVGRESLRQNHKKQTPTTTASQKVLYNWQQWKLK